MFWQNHYTTFPLKVLPKLTELSWHVYTHTHMHTAATAVYGMETVQRSCAFVVQICQKYPAETLIMAGEQSVNDYQETIELSDAWLNFCTVKYTLHVFCLYTKSCSCGTAIMY